MVTFHRDWAFVVVAANLFAGVWGLVRYRRHLAASRGFWIALVAGHLALLTQVVVGVSLYQTRKPNNRLHPFYGFVLLIAAVLSYSFRSEGERRAHLIMSGIAMFVGVVGVRAMLTGFS